MVSAARNLFFSCFRAVGGSSEGSGHRLLPWPRFPSRPRRRKAAAVAADLKKVAVFAVTGMTCAGSVEKAVKRLPGIHDAAVDVLGCRATVAFNPALVSEEKIREAIEDVGFGAKLIDKELKEKS